MRRARWSDCALCGRERWTLWFRRDAGARLFATLPEPSDESCTRCERLLASLGGRPGWLVRTPLWDQVEAFMVVEDHVSAEGPYPRYRLEAEPPVALFSRLVRLLAPCVHCRSDQHPFRRRKTDRGIRLYYTSACPLDVRVGCARSRASHDDHAAVLAALGDAPRPSGRQGSFDWGSA